MKIKDLLIIDENNKFILNWDVISKIDEFKNLKTTYQNPLWHSEGDVWTHTLYVATNALYSEDNRDANNNDFILFIMGALFHDIGKGVCTFFNKEKKSWSSINHAEIGSKMIKHILNDETDENIRIIEFYVKNHMLPLELKDEDAVSVINSINSKMGTQINYFKKLLDLKRCDCLGSIMKKDDKWDEKLNRLYNMYV